jgi:hypothetical protein
MAALTPIEVIGRRLSTVAHAISALLSENGRHSASPASYTLPRNPSKRRRKCVYFDTEL